MDDLHYWLALHQALHTTPLTLKRLLKKFKCPKTILDVYTQDPLLLKVTDAQQQRLRQINWKHIEAELKWAQEEHHHIIAYTDTAYPPLLKEIHDPPILLYVIGVKSVLSLAQIAIVGSRKPSQGGAENAMQFAYDLSKAGLTITSGLALGIDGYAHQGALAAKGATIAVLGCGVNVIYPKKHSTLASAISEHGALLSDHPLNSPPLPENFPRRNRLISGLSQATLVVEAALHSGSLITAHFANEQGRNVFAIPGSIHNHQATGCHHLIKEGASIVSTVQDIMMELNINPSFPAVTKDASSLKGLDTIDIKLIECVGFETRSVQYIIEHTQSCVQTVCSRLLKLELRGYIKAVPGGYCRVKL